MIPVRVREILAAVIKREGHLTTREMELYPQPWYDALPPFNAHPDRMKLCPVCVRSQPIVEFLVESNTLRTASIKRGEFVAPVAEVSEYCHSCSRSQFRKETTEATT